METPPTATTPPKMQIVIAVTIKPSFEFGNVTGRLSSYASASYLHSGIGIENPTVDRDIVSNGIEFDSSSQTTTVPNTSQMKLGLPTYIWL